MRIEDLAQQASPTSAPFRRVESIRGLVVDLRYATTNNFEGRVLYAGIDCAWLRTEACAALEAALDWLTPRHPGLRLVLLDALRPQRVQEAIWRDVAGTPAALYFADPARGSIHSYGMAVDVTLRDAATNQDLDMGSGFDEMSPRSHPALEGEQLAAGAITQAHVATREILRGAMAAGGFQGIPTEWWHFNCGDPERIRRELPRVE